MTADQIIAHLQLQPHPEGGWYRQTWEVETDAARPTGTCIYFLLQAGERSHWHRVDATEIWHFYAGAPLILRIAENDAGPATAHRLGPGLGAGEAPQIIVPPHHWQSAEPTGAWSLTGCTVSPGFRFDGFELASPDFDIP
ncbi:MAG: cupin domain-containing protein [Rhodobacteraceae bacterium]|nr:cupin domain-containing protein [Paracoccaceae bacterium]